MVRLITLAVLGAAGLGISACAPSPQSPPVRADLEPLEAVYAWREDAAGDLVIRVASNGCTTKDSFQVDVTGSAAEAWSFDVALTRLHADRCRAFLPQGVALTWTKDELGLPPSAEIEVLNRVNNGRPPPPPPPPPPPAPS